MFCNFWKYSNKVLVTGAVFSVIIPFCACFCVKDSSNVISILSLFGQKSDKQLYIRNLKSSLMIRFNPKFKNNDYEIATEPYKANPVSQNFLVFVMFKIFWHWCGHNTSPNMWAKSMGSEKLFKGGGSGSEISGAWFWNNMWPKRTPTWANFLVGFFGPRSLGASVAATPIFPPKMAQKSKMETKQHNIDLKLAIDR